MILPQFLFVAHNYAIFLAMKISRWENRGIDLYSIPGIGQPARKSPGIDFSGKRSLGSPDNTAQSRQIEKI